MGTAVTPKTVAVLGAGSRGTMFGQILRRLSQLGQVAAVAEPREAQRQAFAEAHGLEPRRVFRSWQDFVAQGKICDAVIISTLDQEHTAPALACLKLGYDMILEKPMGLSLEETRAIELAQRQSGRIFALCHSLRYQKGFRKVKELLAAGAIGRIMSIDLLEQVAFWHHAHSFVRGNWGRQENSTFMLMSKSCHDVDYLLYLIEARCLRVSSFGSLAFFRRENAPAGSTDRCTDPCPLEPTCAYSAVRQYVDADRETWPADVVSADHSREAHLRAIREGPYGRCAWKCDNDVVDHQVVAMEFDGGITATFTMSAFTQGLGRRLRVQGTEGELAFDESTITIRTFADRNVQTLAIGPEPGGHGGGDERVVLNWLQALHSRDYGSVLANAQESLRSHAIVFAAERSRLEGKTIELSA